MISLYHDQGSVELIETWGSDSTPAHSARVSFARDAWGGGAVTERDARLIEYLASERHTSPFEHLGATLRITAPIYVARQIMRHRTFSFNEVSRRYTSEALEVWHATPDAMRAQSDKNLQCSKGWVEEREETCAILNDALDHAVAQYQALIDRGVAREVARAVLPCATLTTWWQSGNLHAWAHLLRLRMSAHAQPETQEIAGAIAQLLRAKFPHSLSALLGE